MIYRYSYLEKKIDLVETAIKAVSTKLISCSTQKAWGDSAHPEWSHTL